MDNKKVATIVKHFGPQTIEAALHLLEVSEDKDVNKLIELVRKYVEEHFKNMAREVAIQAREGKLKREKLFKGELEGHFIADGGIVFQRAGKAECPECGGKMFLANFCTNMLKTYGGYGGVFMCEHNIYIRAQTGGTGDCEYDAWLPVKEPYKEIESDCVGCPDKGFKQEALDVAKQVLGG